MDVRLSAEQEALADSVTRVVDDLGPKTVQQLGDTVRAAKLDGAIDAAGWRELRVGDDESTPLASGVEVAIVAEELGRGLADASFLGPTLAAELRRLAGALPATSRETVLFETDLSGLADLTSDAVAIDSRSAATALVPVRTPDGAQLGSAEIEPRDEHVDLTQHIATSVPSALLTPVDGPTRSLGPTDIYRWTALGLTITCADLVGTMRGGIDLAVTYVKDRHQYGVPVGSFQAVQHLLADAFVAMEGSRSLTLYAAWAVDALEPAEALAAAAMAKAYAARAARTVGETVIQAHGGIGNTWECLAHVFLRRALVSIEVLGGVGPNLDRVLAHSVEGMADGLR
jgi:alkylation response protein AidB-like acyl-CoA dehydrogenase